MAKVIYYWDENKHFDHSELVDDDFVIPANATTVAPTNGLYEPLTWNDTTWIGTPKEEWMAAHPAPAPTPTAEQQTIAQLTQMVTGLMAKEASANA